MIPFETYANNDIKPPLSYEIKKEIPRVDQYPKIERKIAPVASSEVTRVNESIVWSYLISQGFTKNQTAGIMGNLQQEHNFQTSGDGLAQWTAGRKARLMAMPEPYSLNTQLNFLMIELNETGIGNKIKSNDDLISATLIFQNQFERCGVCAQNNRISYAQAILARY